MAQSDLKYISNKWKITLSIIIGVFILFELMRFIWRLSNYNAFDLNNVILHAAIILILITLLLLTVIGKRSPSLFAIFVIAFNVLIVTIYPYNISKDHNMLYNRLVLDTQYLYSMPEILFYFYILVQGALVFALGKYYFSEYLFNEYLQRVRTSRQIEFEILLKNALSDMELKS
jgi:hypothetical protein